MSDSSEDKAGIVRCGCFVSKTGKETEAVEKFKWRFPEAEAIVPMKTRYRRMGGTAKEESVTLLPGYVFFRAADDAPVWQLRRMDGVLKLLTYPNGNWQLHGADAQFAELLFKAGGRIGLSTACYDEGNRIRILDGFMKDCEGSIIRVNRRAKTAEVRIVFQDKNISMWLGFELIEKTE